MSNEENIKKDEETCERVYGKIQKNVELIIDEKKKANNIVKNKMDDFHQLFFKHFTFSACKRCNNKKLEIDDVNEVGSFKIKCKSCSKSIWYKLKDANESIINDIVTKYNNINDFYDNELDEYFYAKIDKWMDEITSLRRTTFHTQEYSNKFYQLIKQIELKLFDPLDFYYSVNWGEIDVASQGIDENKNTNNETTPFKRKSIPQDVQDKVWNRDEGRCVECGSNENLEFDHIIPHSKGGANTYRNIQLLCEPCNRSKSNKIG